MILIWQTEKLPNLIPHQISQPNDDYGCGNGVHLASLMMVVTVAIVAKCLEWLRSYALLIRSCQDSTRILAHVLVDSTNVLEISQALSLELQ